MLYPPTKQRSTKSHESSRSTFVRARVISWIVCCLIAGIVCDPSNLVAQQRVPLRLPLKNPRIVVLKSKRTMELYSDGAVVRVYKVGLGLNPIPDKQRQGDHATPEGEFYVFVKNNKSAFYLSLGISYPNIEDAERGLRDGLINRAQRDAIVKAIKKKATPPQNTSLGGDIYIHGNGAGSDWTWGCVALENDDMRELFGAVTVGVPVTIKP
jgi:murein L,D-transpeptidase YafK